jgi:hypothetical protein
MPAIDELVLGPLDETGAGIVKLGDRADPGPGAGVTWRVELNYYADIGGVGAWDHALWDAAVWAADTPDAVDIGTDVISIAIGRGRDEPLSRFRPGLCTVLVDDPDGNLSPWATPDPDTYGTIRPGIGLRIVARFGGVDYPRFTGKVTAIVDTFPQITAGGHAVLITAVDGLADLAAYDGLPLAVAVGDGETAGPRIARILASAGYTGPTDLDAGAVPLQPTTLDANALDEAGLVTDTELGALFVDYAGVLTFVDRTGLNADPHYTAVQFTFGELEPELCYADVELVTDNERVRNIISISNVGGVAVTRQDGDSLSLYGPRSLVRTDLIHKNAADSTVIADRYLAVFADASRRVDGLTILPSVNAETIPAALTIGLLWRIQLRRRATGFQVVADLQVETINEEITPREWRVEYRTFSAAGIFTVGKWDVARWDTGLWGF